VDIVIRQVQSFSVLKTLRGTKGQHLESAAEGYLCAVRWCTGQASSWNWPPELEMTQVLGEGVCFSRGTIWEMSYIYPPHRSLM